MKKNTYRVEVFRHQQWRFNILATDSKAASEIAKEMAKSEDDHDFSNFEIGHIRQTTDAPDNV